DRTRPNFHFGIQAKSCACPTPGECRAQKTFLPFLVLNSFKMSLRLLPKIRQSLPCILTKPKVFHLSNKLKLKNHTNCQNISITGLNSSLSVSTRYQSISTHLQNFKKFTMKSYTLVRCGLKKLIYLVEGDPNTSEAAESIKTACFTTEILEGFDVQRTIGLADTLKKYVYLTQAITQYYNSEFSEEQCIRAGVPRPGKMTVSDVFAIQLMQVPQVTEDVAIAVLDLYPTLLSLARAYSLLEGDVRAQEEMLRIQSNNAVNAGASKNIFHLSALVSYQSFNVRKSRWPGGGCPVHATAPSPS
ncbi:Restriction endonuclease, type II-like superfamily protein, partial [Prunus dulcis]